MNIVINKNGSCAAAEVAAAVLPHGSVAEKNFHRLHLNHLPVSCRRTSWSRAKKDLDGWCSRDEQGAGGCACSRDTSASSKKHLTSGVRDLLLDETRSGRLRLVALLCSNDDDKTLWTF